MAEIERHLIAHIGHGKTGSSAIQSALALGADTLLTHSIYYPDHKRRDDAKQGRVTSGNVRHETFAKTCRDALASLTQSGTVLVSNEGLSREFRQDMSPLLDVLPLATSVKLILYLRDPVPLAFSSYGQTLKRGKQVQTLDEYLPGFTSLPNILQFLEAVKDLPVQVEVINYSRHNHRHIARFSEALGLDPDALPLPPVKRVNRSLTRAERALQNCLNAYMGEKSDVSVAKAFCNELPDIDGGKPYLSAEAYHDFIKAQGGTISRINALIPPDATLQLPDFEQIEQKPPLPQDAPFEFSYEQLDVLAKTLAQVVPQGVDPAAVRQLARDARPGHQMTQADVLCLLEMAAAFVPEASGIRKKKDRMTARITAIQAKQYTE